MHNSQRVFGQIGRTLLKQERCFLNKQPQQQLITLSCHLAYTANNDKEHDNVIIRCSKNSSILMQSDPAQKKHYSKFTAARESLPLTGTQLICEERALDLISNLKETELAAIKLALKKYDAKKQKEAFEGKFVLRTYTHKFSSPYF